MNKLEVQGQVTAKVISILEEQCRGLLPLVRIGDPVVVVCPDVGPRGLFAFPFVSEEDAASSGCDWQIDRREPCLVVDKGTAIEAAHEFLESMAKDSRENGGKAVGIPLDGPSA